MLLIQVTIVDVSSRTKMFSLAGPESLPVLEGLGATAPGPGRTTLMGLQGSPVILSEGSGLASPGYTVVVDEQAAGELWRSLAAKVTRDEDRENDFSNAEQCLKAAACYTKGIRASSQNSENAHCPYDASGLQP